jgi:hypothetical protein
MRIFSILFVGFILLFSGCGSDSSSPTSSDLSNSVHGKQLMDIFQGQL